MATVVSFDGANGMSYIGLGNRDALENYTVAQTSELVPSMTAGGEHKAGVGSVDITNYEESAERAWRKAFHAKNLIPTKVLLKDIPGVFHALGELVIEEEA